MASHVVAAENVEVGETAHKTLSLTVEVGSKSGFREVGKGHVHWASKITKDTFWKGNPWRMKCSFWLLLEVLYSFDTLKFLIDTRLHSLFMCMSIYI